MFDLNSDKFKGTVIFNNGNGGEVKEVQISDVSKRKPDEPTNRPDYKVEFVDKFGGKVNVGFFYPEQSNEAATNREVGRVMHIANAVVGADYVFPDVESAKEAYDVLFKIIKKEAGDKLFSVFVNYGTLGFPKKYLQLRYFDFISSMENPNPRVSQVKPDDLLSRVTEDATTQDKADMSADSDDWNEF